jgi:hypothetical protein
MERNAFSVKIADIRIGVQGLPEPPCVENGTEINRRYSSARGIRVIV